MYRIAVISVHTSPLAPPGGYKTGGMNVYVRDLALEMGRRGHQVDIFTRRTGGDPASTSGPEQVELAPGVRVIHLDAGKESFDSADEAYMFLPHFLRSLICFQERSGGKYDVIHSHYWLSGWVGRMLARRWRAPHVTMFHTLGEAKNRARISEHEPASRIRAERRIAQSAERIVCASSDERNVLVRHYGVPAGRVSVIPCGVDVGLFEPIDKRQARRELGIGEERLLLYVGRLEPLKGIDILLRAAAQLSEDLDFRLLIIGGDGASQAEKSKLDDLARRLGIAERTAFIPSVRHERLPLYYSAADVCVVPSYYESFGLVAAEAMACGTPVVASRVGGLATLVQDGITGYLVPWRCPEPFADRLETLLVNEELRGRLGRSAAEAMQSYRWPVVADQVEAVYHDLLALSAEVAGGVRE